jgi:hypothetical protein
MVVLSNKYISINLRVVRCLLHTRTPSEALLHRSRVVHVNNKEWQPVRFLNRKALQARTHLR